MLFKQKSVENLQKIAKNKYLQVYRKRKISWKRVGIATKDRRSAGAFF